MIELIRTGMNKHEATIENYVKPTADYLADYLLKNGVIVPPCKVGDVVYHIHKGKVFGGKVLMISILGSGLIFDVAGGLCFTADEVGKYAFLTKEEAEQALKGGAE